MKKILSVILTLTMIMAISVPAFATDNQQAVYNLAYMDIEQATSESLKEAILVAREEIIFSQSWVADGVEGYVYDKDGNVKEVLPQFSEIFPADWEVPVFETNHSIQSSNPELVPTRSSNMTTLFDDTLTLRKGSDYYNAPAFTSFDTTYWKGYTHYNITSVDTRGYDTEQSSTYRNYFNIGYTNADTGASLGWKTYLESWDTFSISTPSNTSIEVRASMFSDDPNVTSGDWDITVFGWYDILND